MPAEGRENPLLKKGNSDAFFREKYLTKNTFLRPVQNPGKRSQTPAIPQKSGGALGIPELTPPNRRQDFQGKYTIFFGYFIYKKET